MTTANDELPHTVHVDYEDAGRDYNLRPPSDLETLTKRELFAGMLMAGLIAMDRKNCTFVDDAQDAIRATDILLTELAK